MIRENESKSGSFKSLSLGQDALCRKISSNLKIKNFFKALFMRREVGIFLALLLLSIILSIATPFFYQPSNLFNIIRQVSLIAIIGSGMTLTIVGGEFDLSVGSTLGLTAIIMAWFMKAGVNPWIAFLIIIVIAAGIGLINGLLTTKVGMPSFIATLGMLSVLRGITLVIAGGWPISGFNEESSFFFLTGGRIFNIFPIQAIWLIIIMIIAGFIMLKTTFGHHIYATGGNKQAAKLSGVNTDKVKIINFIITSVFTAVAAAIMTGFLKGATPTAGVGMELNAIAAVVIGGTSLAGGSGFVVGTMIGALIMGIIKNGMILVGISVYWQEAVLGFVIIIAVALDALIRRKR